METYVEVKVSSDPVRARFSDAGWFSYLQGRPVIVVGAGGIGSWVTMCLSRIGCTVYLFDADKFEIHNMGGQLVRHTDIMSPKVEAVKDIVESLVGGSTRILTNECLYTNESPTCPIMISAVDTMIKGRKVIFEKWAAIYGDIDEAIYIDGRLLAEDYQVYAVTKGRLDAYRSTIVEDGLIPTENCSLKATTHCSLGIASEIVGILTNFAANQTSKKDIGIELRDIPFRIAKSIPNYLYDITFEYEQTNKQGDVSIHVEELSTVSEGRED